MSIVKYIKSKPRNIQYSPPGGLVDNDFRIFVSQYVPRDPNSINIEHLEDFSQVEKDLYIKYFGMLFHKVYSNFSENSYGSANYHITRLLYDGFSYTLQLWSIQQGYRDYKLNDGRLSFNGERMSIKSNNGHEVHIVRTREPYDTNAWADPENPNIVDTYKITLDKYDQVIERIYAVSLDM